MDPLAHAFRNPFLGLTPKAICFRRFATQEFAQLLNSRFGLVNHFLQLALPAFEGVALFWSPLTRLRGRGLGCGG